MLGYSNGPFSVPVRNQPQMPGNGWIFALISSLLAIWLIIITILLSILFGSNGTKLNKLEDRYDTLNDTTNIIVDCCETILPYDNCTCALPGINASCWNAANNTPPITSGVPPTTDGILYITCEAGNTTVDGNSDWNLGDYIRYVDDAGAWFQNKALGSMGFMFQTFTVPYTCSAFDPTTGNFTITTVSIDSSSIWMQFGSFSGTPSNNASTSCVITTDTLPAFMQDALGTLNFGTSFIESDDILLTYDALAFRISTDLEIFRGTWSNELFVGIPPAESPSTIYLSDMFYGTS